MSGLYRESSLAEDKKLIIFDMGCGKGYLTFAVYDYFKNILGIQTEVTGVDTNSRLMETCQSIAATCEFDGLRFQTGAISDMPQGSIDILIALHACDTATDDAIYLGIANNAKLIVASPCCHKEVRRQLIPSEPFKGILRHGIVLERQSELLTDGIRSLLLEEQGYSTKVFEFVPTEHTPKNNLIAAVLSDRESSKDALRAEIDSLKQIFGIKHQRLEQLLQQ
jgi:SAM-dependent methyltransferase